MKVRIDYTIDVDAEDVLSLMHSYEAVEPIREFLGDFLSAARAQKKRDLFVCRYLQYDTASV